MSNIGAGVSKGHGFSVSSEGVVDLPNGVQADLTTAEGLAAARAQLDAGQLSELKGLMGAMGYKLEGAAFVPDDSLELDVVDRARGGPRDVGAGRDDLDEELAALYRGTGLADPFNANTTPPLYRKVSGTPGFQGAVGAMKEAVQNPSDRAMQAAYAGLQGWVGKTMQPGTNIMEVLYLVFRETIRDNNEDKKYFLVKLQEYNKMAEDLSSYLKDLTDASQRLSESAKGKEGEDYNKATVQVEVRDYKLSGLDAAGNLPYTSQTKDLTREDLNNQIKNLESAQETIRNKRQMASTSFQNFDQKSQQYYNMMSSVLKAMNEMAQGTIRNML